MVVFQRLFSTAAGKVVLAFGVGIVLAMVLFGWLLFPLNVYDILKHDMLTTYQLPVCEMQPDIPLPAMPTTTTTTTATTHTTHTTTTTAKAA